MAAPIPLQRMGEQQSATRQPRIPPPTPLSITSQGSYLQSFKPITLVVYTMKEEEVRECVSQRFQTGRFTTAEQVQQQVMEGLGLPQESTTIFSIWLASKHLQLQLKPYHLPCKIFKRWKDLLSQYTSASYQEICTDQPILTLQRNVFFPLREERKLQDQEVDKCRRTVDLLYHEAVSNVAQCRYPVSRDQLHELASLQALVFAAESGQNADFDTLRQFVVRFYPRYKTAANPKRAFGRLLAQGGLSPLEAAFSRGLASAQSHVTSPGDPHHLKLLYLQFCWTLPYYGSVVFHGQIQRLFNPRRILRDRKVTVAINTECVHIFDSQTPPEIMLFLTYDQLSWGFEEARDEGEDFYSALWLEFDSVIHTEGEERKVLKRVKIFSRQAPMMDAMISRCVADIKQQERELREKSLEKEEEAVPELSSVQTQTLGRNYKEKQLKCSVLTQEGHSIQRKFTLTRALSRGGSRSSRQPTSLSVSRSRSVSPTQGSDAQAQQKDDNGSSQAQLVSGGQ